MVKDLEIFPIMRDRDHTRYFYIGLDSFLHRFFMPEKCARRIILSINEQSLSFNVIRVSNLVRDVQAVSTG